MNERDMQVLEWVVRLAPIAKLESARREGYVFADAHCIAATKIGIQALAYFGIEAVPVTCNLIVGNSAWAQWMNDGMPQPMPDAAWSVAVHEQNTDGPGYNGHVILRADDMLVDLNFGQVSRPAKGIVVPDSTAFRLNDEYREYFEAGKSILYGGDDVTVIIENTPGRQSFKQAKDWKRDHKAATGLLIRMVRKMLEAEAAEA